MQLHNIRYCDVLHRSSLHLGGWSKLQNRTIQVPYNNWAAEILWPPGAIVKHLKEFYKAEGITNAAEPGNASHARLFVSISYYCDKQIIQIWIVGTF